MVEKSIHNNPWDLAKDRFVRLEEKVVDIFFNMSLLFVVLTSNIELFGEVGGSNLEIGSDDKTRDNEDPKKEADKEPKKENPSLNTISLSQSLFNMEEKVDINP